MRNFEGNLSKFSNNCNVRQSDQQHYSIHYNSIIKSFFQDRNTGYPKGYEELPLENGSCLSSSIKKKLKSNLIYSTMTMTIKVKPKIKHWSFITKGNLRKEKKDRNNSKKITRNNYKNLSSNTSGFFDNEVNDWNFDCRMRNSSSLIILKKSMTVNNAFLWKKNTDRINISATTGKINHRSLNKFIQSNSFKKNKKDLYIKNQKKNYLNTHFDSSRKLSQCLSEATSRVDHFPSQFRSTATNNLKNLIRKGKDKIQLEYEDEHSHSNLKKIKQVLNVNRNPKLKTKNKYNNIHVSRNSIHNNLVNSYNNELYINSFEPNTTKTKKINIGSRNNYSFGNNLNRDYLNYPTMMSKCNQSNYSQKKTLNSNHKNLSPCKEIMSFLFKDRIETLQNKKSNIIDKKSEGNLTEISHYDDICKNTAVLNKTDTSSVSPGITPFTKTYEISHIPNIECNNTKNERTSARNNINEKTVKKIEFVEEEKCHFSINVKKERETVINEPFKLNMNLSVAYAMDNVSHTITPSKITDIQTEKTPTPSSKQVHKQNTLDYNTDNMFGSIDEGKNTIIINKDKTCLISAMEGLEILSTKNDSSFFSSNYSKIPNLYQIFTDLFKNMNKQLDILSTVEINKSLPEQINYIFHYNNQNIIYTKALLSSENKLGKETFEILEIIRKNSNLENILLNELIELRDKKDISDNINLIIDLITNNNALISELLKM